MAAVRVTAHTDPLSAEMVRTILTDAGLHPLPLRQAGNVTIAGADQAYYVFVPEQEVEGAMVAIQESAYKQFLW